MPKMIVSVDLIIYRFFFYVTIGKRRNNYAYNRTD